MLDILDKSSKAISYIKKYNQPSMIIMETYRRLEHCGPNNDDYLGYRDNSEIKSWRSKCPLIIFEKKLIKHKILTLNEIKNLEKKIEREIGHSFKIAEKAPFPKLSTSTKHIYE